MVSQAVIEQQRREFGGAPASNPLANAGAILNMDLSQGLVQQWVLNANCFVGEPLYPPPVGGRIILLLTQDGTGSRSVTWGICFRDAPAWSASAAGTRASAEFLWDGFSYQYMGGSTAFAVSGLSLVPQTGLVGLASDAIIPRTNPAPTPGAIALAGVASTVTNRTIVAITPTVGALAAAGIAPLVSLILAPPVATLAIQGQIPTRTSP